MHTFLQRRRQPADEIYAVVDAARDRELAMAARDRFGMPIHSLFAEDAGMHMADVAPYVVKYDLGARYPSAKSGYLDMWVERLGSSAGILLLSSAKPDKVRVHLRNVFRATDEDFRNYYFRFYDPRVLRTFLPACTASDTLEFFGPVRAVFVESERRDQMLIAEPGSTGVRVSEVSLSSPSPPEEGRRNRYR